MTEIQKAPITHTPGPWVVKGSETVIAPHAFGEGRAMVVAWTHGVAMAKTADDSESAANARLISAAPAYALVWALVPEEIKGRIFDALHSPDKAWVEAAIALAEGRTP